MMRMMGRVWGRVGLVVALAAAASCDSELKQEWKSVVAEMNSEATGRQMAHWQTSSATPFVGTDERWGQMCDVYKPSTDTDPGKGCAVVFLADPSDANGVKELPANQQNNFQNTLHYKNAWVFGGDVAQEGFLGDSLPMAPKDIEPVCYVVKMPDGSTALGYEEGEGDVLLPCPGARHAVPYAPAHIETLLSSNNLTKLQDMCNTCYQAVCSGRGRRNPENCGERGGSSGGVQVGTSRSTNTLATMKAQTSPAYHCHVAINDNGACDYVQFNQHEDSRDYYMDYGVYCDWEKSIQKLNLVYCDCTLNAGTANGCERQECLDMAYSGVVCGNCRHCHKNRAYEAIFTPVKTPWDDKSPDYKGHCGAVRSLPDGAEKEASKMRCSKGLFCRTYDANSDGCTFHCEKFGPNSTSHDSACPGESGRRLLEAGFHKVGRPYSASDLVPGFTEISKDFIISEPIRSS